MTNNKKKLTPAECGRIATFYPEYTTGAGRTTAVLYSDGQKTRLSISPRTFLERIASCHAVDLRSAREHARRATGRKNELPLALPPGLVLLPLRTLPLLSGDEGSSGWFSLEHILDTQAWDSPPYRASISLSGGHTVSVTHSPAAVSRQLAAARALQGSQREAGLFFAADSLGQYAVPATRADISCLLREVQELKYLIKSASI